MQLSSNELEAFIAEIDRHLEPEQQADFLKRLNETYEPMRKVKAAAKKTKGKGNAKEA